MKQNMNIKNKMIKETIKYPNREAIRYYIDVTDEFYKLFGNVINQVKIELDEYFDFEYEDEEERRKIEKDMYRMAENTFYYLERKFVENKIDLNGMNIYITFYNGKIIKIWNSDLGGIERV